jgi:hypothetical protein
LTTTSASVPVVSAKMSAMGAPETRTASVSTGVM